MPFAAEWGTGNRTYCAGLIRKRGWGAVTAILAVMLAILLYRPLFVEETEWREFSVRNIYRVGQNLQDIVSGDRVTQTFVASSAFDHILVQGYLKNGAVPDGGCQMLIQDEEGKKLAEAFLSAQQIAETQLDFTFDSIVPDGETVYTIVIEPKGIRENHALQLYRFNSSMDLYPAGKLSCNGREENGNLIFSVYEERTGTIFRRIFCENLQEDIKTGNFRRVYLLCGDEAYLKIQYKDKLIKALNPDDDTMNFSKYEGKGIEVREMIDLCETMPFFADYRVILVENSGFLRTSVMNLLII